jgi:hypothetical protein
MHHCLEIVEILEMIFGNFRVDREAKLGTLANLVATCTFFQRPALDALWWSIYSLDPLRMLMPDDLWVPVENPKRQRSQVRLFLIPLHT